MCSATRREKPEFLPPSYSDVILGQIKQNMTAYGWTEVDKNAKPDVVLLVSASNTTYLYWYYDWAYWGWYYPGYYPGWGWYYPGYYPPYVSSYTTGTLLIQMTDQKAVDRHSHGSSRQCPGDMGLRAERTREWIYCGGGCPCADQS